MNLTRVKSFFGFGGGGVNNTMEGAIPTDWNANWWQQAKKPIQGGDTAIVHACCDAYAQTISTMSVEHYRVNDDGGQTELKDSALSKVIRDPNPYQTRSDFFYYMIKSLMLHGNCYALAYRGPRGEVEQLHPIHPVSTIPMLNRESGDIFYAVGNNPMMEDVEALVPQRDVLHIKLFTPNNPLQGESPIVHAGASIATNTAISNQQATFFANASRPSGVLTTDQMLKANQMQTLREAWESQSAGLATGKVPVLFGGLKFNPLSVTSNDAQIVEAFQMSIEDVARAFRVPLPLVGSYKNSTYNNVEQLIQSWISTGLGFVMEHAELAIEKFFNLPAQQKFNFNTESLLRSDFKGRIEALTKGIQGGLYSPNEARELEGLKSVKDGDEPRMQAQNVPLSQVGKIEPAPTPTTPPAEPTAEETEAEKDKMVADIQKAMTQ